MRLVLATAAALLAAGPAFADLSVRFIEGAPKDRFVFTHEGTCATGAMILTVDLAGSAAGLVFDVTGEGAGVEVFQPFELVSGGERVTTLPQVADGDTSLELALSGLAPGEVVAFTIDLDDTIGAREITVSRSEIVGAGVTLTAGTTTATGAFGEDARTRVALPGCLS
ncbi:MAG: aggregation factor core [Pseudomonadota bacterium]